MARARQPRDMGPPGLGGKVSNDVLFERAHDSHAAIGEISNGENPTPSEENPPLAGTNRQPNEEIPWSGRGEQGASELEKELVISLSDIRKKLGHESERVETLWSEFLDQNAVVAQIGTQLRTLEQTVAQHATFMEECRNAIVMLQQRLDALARQQVQTNTRAAALQLAVQGKASHDPAERVVEQAERFYQFLVRDLLVYAQAQQEVKIVDGVDPDVTQH